MKCAEDPLLFPLELKHRLLSYDLWYGLLNLNQTKLSEALVACFSPVSNVTEMILLLGCVHKYNPARKDKPSLIFTVHPCKDTGS